MVSPTRNNLQHNAEDSSDAARIEAARIARLDGKEWTPRKGTPLAVSLCLGICASLAPVMLQALEAPYNLIASATIAGLAIGLTAHYGIKSSGTPRDE